MDNEYNPKNKIFSHYYFHKHISLVWLDSDKYWIDRNNKKESFDGGPKRNNNKNDKKHSESRINDSEMEPEYGRLSFSLGMINYSHLPSPGEYNNPGSACQLHIWANRNTTNNKSQLMYCHDLNIILFYDCYKQFHIICDVVELKFFFQLGQK